jgi:hypothetical protein
VFSTAPAPTNVDSILDFVSGVEKIASDNAIFTAFAVLRWAFHLRRTISSSSDGMP